MKTKKVLLSILSALFFSFSAFSVISCDGGTSNNENISNSDSSFSEIFSSSEDKSESITQSDSSSEEESHIHEWIVDEIILEATCTTKGAAIYKCETCTETKNEVINALGHTEVIDQEVKPTCETTGLTQGSHCEICNEILVKQEKIDKVDHNYIEQVLTAATCLSDGVTLFTCSECKDVEYEITPAFGHTEVIDQEVKPTCTETGLTQGAHCETCNEVLTKQEVLEALGHSYTSVVTNPTCEEQGYTTHTCENCNDSYIDTYTNELGHSYSSEYYSDETHHWKECSTCEEKDSVEAHIPNIQSATEEDDKVCTVCDYVIEHALGHIHHMEYTSAKKATCTEKGNIEYYYCEGCSSYFADSNGNNKIFNILIKELGHDYQVGDHKDATCLQDGHTIYVCNNDSTHTYTDVHEAIGHNYNSVVTEPTCEEQGYTTHTCSNCNNEYVDTYTNELGHNYQVSSHEDATCTVDGHTTYVCSHDSTHTYTDVHEAIGHNYKSVVTNPTCEEQGYTTHTCSNCNDTYVDSYTNALGHSYEEDYTYDETYHWQTSLCGHDVVSNYEKHDLVDGYCQKCSYKEEQEHYTDGLVFVYDDDYDYKGYCVYDYTGTNNNVVIPLTYNGLPVTSIGDYAFDNCTSLTSITIPDGVTNIGDYAFYNCSSLIDVYYMGTEKQWNAIFIKNLNECLTNATIHFVNDCNSISGIYELDLDTSKLVYVSNIKGVITFIFDPRSGFDESVFIEDENGFAVMLYNNTDLLDDYEVGDTIMISGDVVLYNGYPEIKNITSVTKITGKGEIALDAPIEITKDNVDKEWVLANNYQVAKIYNAEVLSINSSKNTLLCLGGQELILYNTTLPDYIQVGDYIDITCVIFSYYDIVEARTSSIEDTILRVQDCEHEMVNVTKTYGDTLSATGYCIHCSKYVTKTLDEETSNMIKALKNSTDWGYYYEELENGIIYEHFYNYETNYSYERYIQNGTVIEEYLINEFESIYHNVLGDYYQYGTVDGYIDYWWAFPTIVADLLYDKFYCFELGYEVQVNVDDLYYFTTYNKAEIEDFLGYSFDEFWEEKTSEEFYYTIAFRYEKDIISFPIIIFPTEDDIHVGHFGNEREFYSQADFQTKFNDVIDAFDNLYEHTNNGLTFVKQNNQLVDGTEIILTYQDVVMSYKPSDKNYFSSIQMSQITITNKVQVVTLEKSGAYWLLKLGDNDYLYYDSNEGGNYLKSGNVTDVSALWSINVIDGIATITNVGSPNRLLQYNSDSPRFSCYLYNSSYQDDILHNLTIYIVE